MPSEDLETIMSEIIDDMTEEPEVNEEVLRRFMDKTLRRVRLWED